MQACMVLTALKAILWIWQVNPAVLKPSPGATLVQRVSPAMSQSPEPEPRMIALSPSARRACRSTVSRLSPGAQCIFLWLPLRPAPLTCRMRQTSQARTVHLRTMPRTRQLRCHSATRATLCKRCAASAAISATLVSWCGSVCDYHRPSWNGSTKTKTAGAGVFVLRCLAHPASTLLDEAGGAGTPAEQPLATPLLLAWRTLAQSVQRFEGSSGSAPRVHIALSGLDLKGSALCVAR
jgi:hypothetical protein